MKIQNLFVNPAVSSTNVFVESFFTKDYLITVNGIKGYLVAFFPVSPTSGPVMRHPLCKRMTTVQLEKIPQRRVDNFRKLLEMGYSTHFDNCFHWTSNGINIESWEMVLTLDDMGLDDLAYYFVCKSHIEEAIEQERISQLSLEVKTLTSGIPNNGISFLSEEYLMPVLRKMLAYTGDEFYQDVVNTTKTTNLRYEQIAEMLTSLSGAEEKTKNTYDIEVILSWGNPEAMTRMTRITFPLIQNLPLLKSLLS